MNHMLLLIGVIFLLLLGNGFFSGSEIAVISMRRSKIESLVAQGRRSARRLQHLHENLPDFLATVQIGVTLMGTLAGVIGGYLAKLYIEPAIAGTVFAGWISPAVTAAILVGAGIVYVELILGELVPKALALRFTDTVALLVARPLDRLARITHPFVVFLTASTRTVLMLFGIREAGHRTFVSEEEIKHLVKEGRAQGVLDQTEEELIHSVFEFSETPVKKVMVPRPKMFTLDVDTPPGEAERLMVESGFSRIPVYDSSPDNMIGVVYIKDALRLLEKRQPVVLRKIVHPVHLVPETKKVGALLKELQKRRSHLALVIDEHGSLVGLVTMEDLLEEIVGEIQDEYDWEERPVERLRDGSMVVEGTLSADVLRLGQHVPIPESAEFETVAGFMLATLGSVPRGGEVVQVGDYRLTVVDVEKNRINKVKIEKIGAPAAASPGKAALKVFKG
jgi:magnesium and cobalt exporter, CNNM family